MQLKNSAAYLTHPRHPLSVGSAPIPSCNDNELIIQTEYVAINPVDWKIQLSDGSRFGIKYPTILGQDVAGSVIEVGGSLKQQLKKNGGFKVGDRVIAHAQGLHLGKSEYGGFQKYVLAREEEVCLLPESVTFEEGVVLPLSISTASAGLYLSSCLELRYPSLDSREGELSPFSLTGDGVGDLKAKTNTLLLWGGSSSVGSSVIQLAAASGYHVITTASPANYQYCKLLGATMVLDYHNPDIVPILVSIVRGSKVVGAYDAIGSDTTVRQCASVLHAVGGGKVVSVGSAPGGLFEDVKVVGIGSGDIVGKEPEVARKIWREYLGAALRKERFVPAPKALVVGEGLESVQESLDRQKQGVSARKVVVKL